MTQVFYSSFQAKAIKPRAAEIETFFRGFKVDISGYKFDRDDANAK